MSAAVIPPIVIYQALSFHILFGLLPVPLKLCHHHVSKCCSMKTFNILAHAALCLCYTPQWFDYTEVYESAIDSGVATEHNAVHTDISKLVLNELG